MKKKLFLLVHDYWHYKDSIEPLVQLLASENLDITFTRNPKEYLGAQYDLFLSFKDPIENDQIPTPVWCDDEWTTKFLNDVKNGMGTVLLHAALTDLPSGHKILNDGIRSTFITHPEQCKVTFLPVVPHPVLEGVHEFEFPEKDEHYVMEMLPGVDTTIIAETASVNGRQPGVWVHTYGAGKICCITPGHSTSNLTCEPFVKLVKNAVNWVDS